MYFINDKNETQKYPYINCLTFSIKQTNSKQKAILFHNHNHTALEILAITQGSMHLVTETEDYILNSGDVAVINPLSLHFGEVHKNMCEYICVTVEIKPWLSLCGSEMIKTAEQILEEEYCFSELYNCDNEIFRLILSIKENFKQENLPAKCRLIESLYSTFAILFENLSVVSETRSKTRNAQFLKNVTKFIQEHYKENISTCNIAKKSYMTVPSFCYAFKHNFGTSFIKYLSDFRINKAIELASKKEYSLYSLAEEVGFLDYNYFSRTFKKVTGISPAEYFGKRKVR